MPVSTDFVENHLSGCPFTNFGPCKTHKCYFFVAVPPRLDPDERACIISALYAQTLSSKVLLQLAVLPSVLSRENEIQTAVPLRISQTIADSLASLEGLLSHPKTSSVLKNQIKELKSEIHAALETFAASK